MKTSELTGAALNWAVHYVEGLAGVFAPVNYCKWEHGGPIIEREMIELVPQSDSLWDAMYRGQHIPNDGPTPLIAAMRCYVASKLGDEIEIPKELK